MDALNALAKDGKINQDASIKDGHSIVINSPANKVWDLLINIKNWPDWNPVVKSIKVDSENIREGAIFTWNLNGTRIHSQIQSIDPKNSISCTGKSRWVKSIFVWQLTFDENQTIVTLDASMQGAFAVMFKNHQKIYDDLIKWLHYLKKTVEE